MKGSSASCVWNGSVPERQGKAVQVAIWSGGVTERQWKAFHLAESGVGRTGEAMKCS